MISASASAGDKVAVNFSVESLAIVVSLLLREIPVSGTTTFKLEALLTSVAGTRSEESAANFNSRKLKGISPAPAVSFTLNVAVNTVPFFIGLSAIVIIAFIDPIFSSLRLLIADPSNAAPFTAFPCNSNLSLSYANFICAPLAAVLSESSTVIVTVSPLCTSVLFALIDTFTPSAAFTSPGTVTKTMLITKTSDNTKESICFSFPFFIFLSPSITIFRHKNPIILLNHIPA